MASTNYTVRFGVENDAAVQAALQKLAESGAATGATVADGLRRASEGLTSFEAGASSASGKMQEVAAVSGLVGTALAAFGFAPAGAAALQFADNVGDVSTAVYGVGAIAGKAGGLLSGMSSATDGASQAINTLANGGLLAASEQMGVLGANAGTASTSAEVLVDVLGRAESAMTATGGAAGASAAALARMAEQMDAMHQAWASAGSSAGTDAMVASTAAATDLRDAQMAVRQAAADMAAAQDAAGQSLEQIRERMQSLTVAGADAGVAVTQAAQASDSAEWSTGEVISLTAAIALLAAAAYGTGKVLGWLYDGAYIAEEGLVTGVKALAGGLADLGAEAVDAGAAMAGAVADDFLGDLPARMEHATATARALSEAQRAAAAEAAAQAEASRQVASAMTVQSAAAAEVIALQGELDRRLLVNAQSLLAHAQALEASAAAQREAEEASGWWDGFVTRLGHVTAASEVMQAKQQLAVVGLIGAWQRLEQDGYTSFSGISDVVGQTGETLSNLFRLWGHNTAPGWIDDYTVSLGDADKASQETADSAESLAAAVTAIRGDMAGAAKDDATYSSSLDVLGKAVTEAAKNPDFAALVGNLDDVRKKLIDVQAVAGNGISVSVKIMSLSEIQGELDAVMPSDQAPTVKALDTAQAAVTTLKTKLESLDAAQDGDTVNSLQAAAARKEWSRQLAEQEEVVRRLTSGAVVYGETAGPAFEEVKKKSSGLSSSLRDAAQMSQLAASGALAIADAYGVSEAAGMRMEAVQKALAGAYGDTSDQAALSAEALASLQELYGQKAAGTAQTARDLAEQAASAWEIAAAEGQGTAAAAAEANHQQAIATVRQQLAALDAIRDQLDAQHGAKLVTEQQYQAALLDLDGKRKTTAESRQNIEDELNSKTLAGQLSSLNQLNTSLQEQVTLQGVELGLVGASEATRSRTLALAKLQLQYEGQIAAATGDHKTELEAAYARAVSLTGQYWQMDESLTAANNVLATTKDILGSVYQTVSDTARSTEKDWGSALDSIASKISSTFDKLADTYVTDLVLNITGLSSLTGSTTPATTTTTTDANGNLISTSNTTALTSAGLSNIGQSSTMYSVGDSIARSLGLTNDLTGTAAADVIGFMDMADGATTSLEALSSTGEALASGLSYSGWGVVGSLIGSSMGWTSGDSMIDMGLTTVGSIGGSIAGSALGSAIGGTLLGMEMGAILGPIGAIAGALIGTLVSTMFEDIDYARGGFSMYATESGQAASAGTWALDDMEQSDVDSMASTVVDATNTLMSAVGATLDAASGMWAMGVSSNGYDGMPDGYYYTQGQTQTDIGGYETADEALIAMWKDMASSGAWGAVSDEMLTVVSSSLTTSAETFAQELALAYNWDDIISVLSTGTIDYTSSIKESADSINAEYLTQIQEMQDLASDGGLNLNQLNGAWSDAILMYLGLQEAGEAAYTDAQYAYMEAYEQVAGAGDLLMQVGYTARQTRGIIEDAKESLQLTAISDFYASIDAASNSYQGKDWLNSFGDLVNAYNDNMAYAGTIGADTAQVTGLLVESIGSVLTSADNLGTAATELSAAFPDLAASIWSAYDAVKDTTSLWSGAFSALGDSLSADLISFDAERLSGRGAYAGTDLEVYDATTAALRAQMVYDSTSAAWEAAKEDEISLLEDEVDQRSTLVEALRSLADTAADLRLDSSLSPLSPLDLLGEAEAQWNDAVSRAYDTSLSDTDRTDAIADLRDLASARLEASLDYNDVNAAYYQDYLEVQSVLTDLSGRAADELDSQTSILRAQLDALNAVADSSASTVVSLSGLEASMTAAYASLTAALSSLGTMVSGSSSLTSPSTVSASAIDWGAYLAANPDVAAAGVDPATHYYDYGATEGRTSYTYGGVAVSGSFDAAGYLAANPDVAAAGVDPYQHFVEYGRAEGRVATDTLGNAYQNGGIVGAYESGGIIGNGLWGRDSVIAAYAGGGSVALAGGEGVLTAEATMGIGGASAIDWINRERRLPANDRWSMAPSTASAGTDLSGLERRLDRIAGLLERQLGVARVAGRGTVERLDDIAASLDAQAAGAALHRLRA